MTYSMLQILAGFVFLYGGGEALIAGASRLALRLRMSPLVVSLTVVALGTSSPELVVSVDSALSGHNDIAVGNVVGSNIGNIALILALAALIRPVDISRQLLRFDLPVLFVVSLLLPVLLFDGAVSRVDGAILVGLLIAYVGFLIVKADPAQMEEPDLGSPKKSSVGKELLWIVGGLGVLIVGAHLFVEGAVVIAQDFGVSEAAIGLTIVAVGTSLPEMATSVLAAYRSKGDIAAGNIIGSNILSWGSWGSPHWCTRLSAGGSRGWTSASWRCFRSQCSQC